MNKLHEHARRLGVETQEEAVYCESCDMRHWKPRPDLDIAHDLLAKLPSDTSFELDWWGTEWRWEWYGEPECAGNGTFIEAVLALCERSVTCLAAPAATGGGRP